MNLIKTSALNAISVVVRMIAMLGINKVLAIYVGPTGYAIVGQFYNAVQMITNFASGAINVGVVKYTAEHADNQEYQTKIWKTSGTIALIGSVLASIIIALFHKNLSVFFLKDESLSGVFLWFAASLTLFVFNTLLLAILNGKKEVKSFVTANIAGSILSLIFTIWLTRNYQLYGALIGLGTFQAVAFFITLFLCLKKPWFQLKDLVGECDKDLAIKLSKYTLMSLTTAVCVPISHMLIRNYLGKTLGWDSAGYWEAMWKLSAAYLMVVTTTLSVYYLPRISELKTAAEIKNEIWSCFKLIVPFSMFCSFMIYILKDHLITILFTPDFVAMKSLFFWQMIGDTVKIASWILAFVFLGKGMTKFYIISEVIFTFLFYGLILILTPYFKLESTAIAHAINYVGYFIFVYFALRTRGYVK